MVRAKTGVMYVGGDCFAVGRSAVDVISIRYVNGQSVANSSAKRNRLDTKCKSDC